MNLTIPTTLPQPVATQAANEVAAARWYAVYTCARHEKRVAEQMERRKLHGFVPVYLATHRWKDRSKDVVLALFPSYVFVHLALQDRRRVLEIPGVVSLVGPQGKPTPLAAEEIEPFRRAADSVQMEPHPYLRTGPRCACGAGRWWGSKGFFYGAKKACG